MYAEMAFSPVTISSIILYNSHIIFYKTIIILTLLSVSHSQSLHLLSIMTFLAFDTTDIGHFHTVHFAILEIIMKLLVNAVVIVALAV